MHTDLSCGRGLGKLSPSFILGSGQAGEATVLTSGTIWLLIWIAVYGGACLYFGLRFRGDGPGDTAWRSPGLFCFAIWVVIPSGWLMLGLPGLVRDGGFPAATLSLAVIFLSLIGILFHKRLWILARYAGFVTAPGLLGAYYHGRLMGAVTVAVALLSAVPVLAVLLIASGVLVHHLSGGVIGATGSAWVLGIFLLVYTAMGGLAGTTRAAVFQGLLLVMGLAAMAALSLDALGGWDALKEGLRELAATGAERWGTTQGRGGGDYNLFFAISGAFGTSPAQDAGTDAGMQWTGLTIFSVLVALGGIPLAPGLWSWYALSPDPRPTAGMQIWALGFGVGLIAIPFAVFSGLVGNASAGVDILPATARTGPVFAHFVVGFTAKLLPLIDSDRPWLVGLLGLSVLAALQAAAAMLLLGTGSLLASIGRGGFSGLDAGDATEIRRARWAMAILLIAALLVASLFPDHVPRLAGSGLAIAVQMGVPLAGACWLPWITRNGAVTGLLAGVLAVLLTDGSGVRLLAWLGIDAWHAWPQGVHPALWGLATNLVCTVSVSVLTRQASERAHRGSFHDFLAEHGGLAENKRDLAAFGWAAALIWLFFAVGPGAIIGNDLFGAPDGNPGNWDFAIPSLWAWQILGWGLGVALLWFLGIHMSLATLTWAEIEAIRLAAKPSKEAERRD